MDGAFTEELEPWLACLVHDPSDAVALAQLHGAFETLLAGTDEAGQLPRAIEHLLQGLVAGTVAPNMAAVELLVDACSALTGADTDRELQLIERLDAFASGLGDVPMDLEPAPARAPEPPLLTVREDGSRIVPGAFDTESTATGQVEEASLDPPPTPPQPENGVHDEPAPPAQTPTTAAEIVAALEPAVDRLGTQIGTLELLAGPDLERLANDLSSNVAEVAQLKDALVAWMEGENADPS